MIRSLNSLVLLALGTLVVAGCSRDPAPAAGPPAAATFRDGVITEAEVQREAQRLPAGLREQFESEAGRREFIRSMVDKRLLELEARKRGLHERPDIRRQVEELEVRLIVQALLAEEERAVGAPGEAAAREYYQRHQKELTEPERMRVARVQVAIPVDATEAARKAARQKAESLASRLRRGESLATIGPLGDGPERLRGGELGLFAPGEFPDAALEDAASSLTEPGALSPVIAQPDAYSFLVLMERVPSRVPAFEEVRSAVENRLMPSHQRKVFDGLLEKLRREQDINVHAGAQR